MAKKSIFDRQIHPWWQGLVIVLAYVVFSVLGVLSEKVGLSAEDPYFIWSIAATLLLFYAIFNSILSLPYENQNRYWISSVLVYIGLLIVFFFVSWLVSGIHINDAKSYRFIFFIFSFGYLVILSIIRAMRKIVIIAQKQDKRLRGEE